MTIKDCKIMVDSPSEEQVITWNCDVYSKKQWQLCCTFAITSLYYCSTSLITVSLERRSNDSDRKLARPVLLLRGVGSTQQPTRGHRFIRRDAECLSVETGSLYRLGAISRTCQYTYWKVSGRVKNCVSRCGANRAVRIVGDRLRENTESFATRPHPWQR